MFRKLENLVVFAETPFQFHKGFRTSELVSLQCLRGIRTVRCIFLMTEFQHTNVKYILMRGVQSIFLVTGNHMPSNRKRFWVFTHSADGPISCS